MDTWLTIPFGTALGVLAILWLYLGMAALFPQKAASILGFGKAPPVSKGNLVAGSTLLLWGILWSVVTALFLLARFE